MKLYLGEAVDMTVFLPQLNNCMLQVSWIPTLLFFWQLQIYEPTNQNTTSPSGYAGALSGLFMLIRCVWESLVHTY